MPQSKIRLLSVIARLNVGGPAVQLNALMSGLLESDVHQVLLTGRVEQGEREFPMADDRLRIRRLPYLGRRIDPQSDIRSLLAIRNFISAFRPDIIHTHTAKAGVLGRLASMTSAHKARRVHTFHGHLLHGYFGNVGTQAIITTERALAKHTDRIIAVGSQVADDLLCAGVGQPQQYRIVPPGTALRPLPERSEARRLLGLVDDQFIVCFIGRLTAVKRIDRLADVADTLRDQHGGVRIIVAGSGDQSEYLQQRIRAENLPISMYGWRDDVETFLAASDAMVLTSENEGTPVSLIQAGLAGLPAVSTDVGAVRDILVDGKTGLVVDQDVMSISNGLSRLLASATTREAFGVQARRHCQSRFGAPTLVEAHLGIYRELMEETPIQ